MNIAILVNDLSVDGPTLRYALVVVAYHQQQNRSLRFSTGLDVPFGATQNQKKTALQNQVQPMILDFFGIPSLPNGTQFEVLGV